LSRNAGDFSGPESDIEYHVVRDGVNQDEIINLLKRNNFYVEYYSYTSTQLELSENAIGTKTLSAF